MSHTIAARLLGVPQVLLDGAEPPPELNWRKHLAVCFLLWLSPDRQRGRDQLVSMLWADKPERAARHSLNEALRVIRRSAGNDALVTTGDMLCWRGAVTLDLDDFAASAANDPVRAAGLVNGELCEGFMVPDAGGFEEWLAAERRDWCARCVAVLVRAAAARDSAGDSIAASDYGARALRLDPFSDLAVQAVIRSRWLLGDRGGAIAVGQGFRQRLAETLGATPDAATASLLSDIGRNQRQIVAPPVPSPRRVALIGRRDELATLLSGWRCVNSGRTCELAIVEGDPGSGRTRMIEETLARAALDGASTVLVRAVDADAESGADGLFGLLHGAMLELPGIAAAPPAALASLAARRGEWAERYPGAVSLTGLPLTDALAAVLRTTAEERPLVLAIDDVERIGPPSQRALKSLLRGVEGAPILVLLSMQRGESSDDTDALRRAARNIVRLTPWLEGDLVELTVVRLGDWTRDAQARLARRLMAESGGLPAIAVELLEATANGLELDSSAPPWPAPDRTLDHTLPTPMPVALVAALRMAFRKLDVDAQTVLTSAALLGEPFQPENLRRLWPDLDHASILDRLEWQCWLIADARGYAFRARTVRRMIADEMLTPGQRQRLLHRITSN